MIKLSQLGRCFQGVIPSVIATCAADGTPNVTYLSHVYYVDPTHVALSCQFFNKTRRNIDENPLACVNVVDPLSYEAYRLDLRFDHAETSGPLFETMALRIQAIASHTGMTGVFRLIAADVYQVLSVEKIDGFLIPGASEVLDERIELGALTEIGAIQCLSNRINRARNLDEVLTIALAALEEVFGFRHSMVLLADETGQRLVTTASRGYGERGTGAEVAVGEGLIGTVARERRSLSVATVGSELRYGRAVRDRIEATSGCKQGTPEIPLPGLPDPQSQLALPLVVQDRLVGVLAVESRDPVAFAAWHEMFLGIIGNQIAIAIDTMEERAADDEGDAPPAAAAAAAPRRAPSAGRAREACFYKNDDCVFIDGEYLIRNVPGKILWKLLRAHEREGRSEFSNRELRLDPWLGLPPVRDNLESRLILLRKRLEDKCPEIRIVPVRRGRFRLELDCALSLEERESAALRNI